MKSPRSGGQLLSNEFYEPAKKLRRQFLPYNNLICILLRWPFRKRAINQMNRLKYQLQHQEESYIPRVINDSSNDTRREKIIIANERRINGLFHY